MEHFEYLALTTHSDQIIVYVVNYINGQYAQPLSLEHISKKFYISKNHLNRLFKQNMNTTVHQYIISLRLSAACNFMENGYSPNDIYYLCGFSDYASFYRAFKTKYHLSPREYLSLNKI